VRPAAKRVSAERMDLTPYDDPEDAVGVAFRATRRRLRLSQRELASVLGWDPATVGRWESGHVSPALGRVDGVLRGMGFRLAVVVARPEEWAGFDEPPEHATDRALRHLPAHLGQDVKEVRPSQWWQRSRHDPKALAPVWTYARRGWWDEYQALLAREDEGGVATAEVADAGPAGVGTAGPAGFDTADPAGASDAGPGEVRDVGPAEVSEQE